MKKVIVCGAGIGGMVSAIYLSNKGYHVEIFEKNLKPGGKINEFKKNGFRFDTVTPFVTMPHIYQDFFNDISKDMRDYLDLVELDCSCKYFWSDGTVFNSYISSEKLSMELKEVFGGIEEQNFFRYLEYGKLFYDLFKDDFLREDFKIRDYISKDKIKNITKFVSGRSINDVSNKFFKNKKLKQLMDRFSFYVGSSAYLAPQFFSFIPYIEYKFGVWYVKGGIFQISKALEHLCEEYKIKINYGYMLTAVESSNKLISKLNFKTASGSIKLNSLDLMVSNFTNNKSLIEEGYFDNTDWSCSAFILFMGMEREFVELSHYNILFSDDYEKEFIDIFEKKIPADDMTIYISITKKVEKNHAPEKCENWFILVNAPFVNELFTWTEENKIKYKEKIIDRIESFSYLFNESIRNYISFCEIYTPLDFMNDYNSEYGSLNGLSLNSLYTLLKRPRNKSRKFDNLFFVGGNTYPGGGIPSCFISGKIISQLNTSKLYG